MTDERSSIGSSQEAPQIYRFNLEEIECATQYFSEVNLLSKKSSFAATYKGILRDGTEVAVKRINKTSCKSEEAEFLMGLKALTLLRHENLVGLRGFCYSRARGECFLIYDFVANGSLLEYLDVKCDEIHKVLDWSVRVCIIKGIAKGMEYLHSDKPSKPSLLHQNMSSTKVLIDRHFNPLLSSSALHKLLADDAIFSSLKTCPWFSWIKPPAWTQEQSESAEKNLRSSELVVPAEDSIIRSSPEGTGMLGQGWSSGELEVGGISSCKVEP
ncbi:probable serine/threonine-protein kinase At1g01540 [Zingiber officinale]|uniref:probable serine/threonine-protein kinase At1g01540 n=1 Tax=Zingiber officinale TaxID=94328 RepID=UPI001C4C41D6|nr:probable serine/threonine-protein kinase At1g01540 [Zingiber officinale]